MAIVGWREGEESEREESRLINGGITRDKTMWKDLCNDFSSFSRDFCKIFQEDPQKILLKSILKKVLKEYSI